MIYFFADNHYDTRAGFCLNEKLKMDYNIKFHEDDLSAISSKGFFEECELLVINLICGTGKLGMPGQEIEGYLKQYCESGRPLFLIHAGSAAFWQWTWWRKLTGLRWVRENDPDDIAPSVHPLKDFSVKVVNAGHALSKELKGFKLENDEIYTMLEKTGPLDILMETTIAEGTYPMAYVSKNQWNGTVLGFLPGHRQESLENVELIYDVKTMINYVLK
jgi:hypothetical protein